MHFGVKSSLAYCYHASWILRLLDLICQTWKLSLSCLNRYGVILLLRYCLLVLFVLYSLHELTNSFTIYFVLKVVSHISPDMV